MSNDLIRGLLSKNLDPETAKLMDAQLRQQQQQPTQYGGRFGGLLTATSGAIKSAQEAGRQIGGALSGQDMRGPIEKAAAAKQGQQLKQKQQRVGEVARLVNQQLAKQLKGATPEQAMEMKQKAASVIRNVASGTIDADKFIGSMLTAPSKEDKKQVITGNDGGKYLYNKTQRRIEQTILPPKGQDGRSNRTLMSTPEGILSINKDDHSDKEMIYEFTPEEKKTKPKIVPFNEDKHSGITQSFNAIKQDPKLSPKARKNYTDLTQQDSDSWAITKYFFGDKEDRPEQTVQALDGAIKQMALNIQLNSGVNTITAVEEAIKFVKAGENPFEQEQKQRQQNTSSTSVPKKIKLTGSVNEEG